MKNNEHECNKYCHDAMHFSTEEISEQMNDGRHACITECMAGVHVANDFKLPNCTPGHHVISCENIYHGPIEKDHLHHFSEPIMCQCVAERNFKDVTDKMALLTILQSHGVGSENAVQVLQRIIKERDEARALYTRVGDQAVSLMTDGVISSAQAAKLGAFSGRAAWGVSPDLVEVIDETEPSKIPFGPPMFNGTEAARASRERYKAHLQKQLADKAGDELLEMAGFNPKNIRAMDEAMKVGVDLGKPGADKTVWSYAIINTKGVNQLCIAPLDETEKSGDNTAGWHGPDESKTLHQNATDFFTHDSTKKK